MNIATEIRQGADGKFYPYAVLPFGFLRGQGYATRQAAEAAAPDVVEDLRQRIEAGRREG